MTYKIMQLSSSNASGEYWTFVKVDSTSTTVFNTTSLDDVETKLKELMATIPIANLKVITEVAFTNDLIFS